MNWKTKTNGLQAANIGIYDALPNHCLFLSCDELCQALSESLIGQSFSGLPLRSRSKEMKLAVCAALKLTPPKSFKKCQPRFPNQDFDIYIQKSNNLQIWNEEISPNRRYAIIHLDENDIVDKVRVIIGLDLAKLDNTGTLTQKYQARVVNPLVGLTLFSSDDIIPVSSKGIDLTEKDPLTFPQIETLMPIKLLGEKLKRSINYKLDYGGADQERNRGGELHELVCDLLGYPTWNDDGQFPDIKNQLLELKLQTSPTIDLGLFSPTDTQPTNYILNGNNILHNQIRYAVFYAHVIDSIAEISGVAIGYGIDFYKQFPQFGGKTVNRKIQIPLPRNFFS